MKVSVYNQKGETVGEMELNPKIFEVKPSKHLLAEAVRVHQANARGVGGHTKTRGEVSGGGRKPWKQKGTGRARVGSIRSPIWRHGGVTFGPRLNRNWQLKLNKKVKTKALFMSLSDKAANHQCIVIDQIDLPAAKTKEFVKIMGFWKNAGKKQMMILPKADQKLMMASRNIPSMHSVLANSLNVVDVLKADTLVVLKEALGVIEKVYLKDSKKK